MSIFPKPQPHHWVKEVFVWPSTYETAPTFTLDHLGNAYATSMGKLIYIQVLARPATHMPVQTDKQLPPLTQLAAIIRRSTAKDSKDVLLAVCSRGTLIEIHLSSARYGTVFPTTTSMTAASSEQYEFKFYFFG